jgi:hypothetical protein
MNNAEKYPIKEEWEAYYTILERIRESGITNMFGAAPYLKEFCPELSHKEAQAILVNWMRNYNELNKKYGWRE